MARWNNFSIWRGRLPHWRADDVTYYVTFRTRRELLPDECVTMLSALRRTHGKNAEILIACVLPEQTELMLRVPQGSKDLSDVVERAKSRAGKSIIKATGERFPPFYTESYDRIVRDDAEFEERWEAIIESPVAAELCEDPDDYEALWVPDAPSLTGG